LPSEESVLLALRTQQILAHESGVARTADPLGGSYYVESLTDELERRIEAMIERIEARGGVVAGIEDGSLEGEIADSAFEQQRQIERGERAIVGVNCFTEQGGEEGDVETFTVGPDVLERQLSRLERVRAERDEAAVAAALDRLEQAARGDENTMPAMVAAVRTYATVGEISRRLVGVFGRHEPSQVI